MSPVGLGSTALETFSFSNFDTTSPASWMSLGAAFKATYGRDGTQEELVSTYMAMQKGLPAPALVNSGPNPLMQNAWQGPYQQQPVYIPSQRINTWETREQDEVKRGGRQVGHGSYDDGVGYAAQAGRWQHSDAVVLTGGDD
jgi:protein NRD1